jgi:hypothetical protein
MAMMSMISGTGKLVLEFALEGAVKDRGKQGVKFGGGLGLQALERSQLGLQRVKLCDYAALFGEGRICNRRF